MLQCTTTASLRILGHGDWTPIKKIQEITNLIAELAYEACGVFANQRDTRYKYNVAQHDIA